MTKEIMLPSGHVTIVSDEDYDMLSKHKWYASNGKGKYYVSSNTKIEGFRRHILMHRLIMGILDNPDIQVDHINGDTLDNRRENLRICNRAQNSQNKIGNPEASSIFKGVIWDPIRCHWIMSINSGGKYKHVRSIKNEWVASLIYDLLAFDMFGDFAKYNHSELMEHVINKFSSDKPENNAHE